MNYNLLKKIDFEKKDIGGKRYYIINNKPYRSVTNFVNRKLKVQEKFKEWRKSIGDREADMIAKEALESGTLLHKCCEDFLLGNKVIINKNYIIKTLFEKYLQHLLLKTVNNIKGVEFVLYSDKLRLAGTADLIADWEGDLSIIDFKTSTYPKPEEWIDSYFLQTTIYGLMLEERFKLIPDNVVIVMVNKRGVVDDTIPPITLYIKNFEKEKKRWKHLI
jgi:genome maintenance exonuclease 1